MSISLVLIPLALAIRAAISVKHFDQWVADNQIKYRSTIRSKSELAEVAAKSGYHLEEINGLIKMQLASDSFFTFWVCENGVWSVVFSQADAGERIAAFMQSVNQAVGKLIFAEVDQVIGQHPLRASNIYPTDFRDSDLLLQTLHSYGLQTHISANKDTIECRVEQTRLVFTRHADAPFDVAIINAPNIREIYHQLSDWDDEYKRALQTSTYEKLKTRIAEQQMTIESEQLMEDDSIVITVNIRGDRS